MKLNLGSGQKRQEGYTNVDISDNHNHDVDVIADISEALPFEDNSAEVIIAEHVLEHIYLHKQEGALREWYRILQPGGALVICVPNLRVLATRYLNKQIDFFTYAVNKFGPYNGNDADFHKWGFDEAEMQSRLGVLPWRSMVHCPAGKYPIAMDWWILSVEATK